MLYLFIIGLFVVLGILFLSSVELNDNYEDDNEYTLMEEEKESHIYRGWSCDSPPDYLQEGKSSDQYGFEVNCKCSTDEINNTNSNDGL